MGKILDHSELIEWFGRLSLLDDSLRQAELAQLQAHSPELATELKSLLKALDASSDFPEEIEATRAVTLLDEDSDLSRPRRVGPYALDREIGRGGIGVVYLAHRVEGGFKQRVAVKLIKRGMDSDSILKRFQAERSILAGLQHPNICNLVDGGVLEDGRPYFAMEYIEGVRITQWCDDNRLVIRDRLELFEQVCRAVQYAHSRLIVHRDLKPANILVTGQGVVKLLDFGIAKLLDKDDHSSTSMTIAGVRVMTRNYAAPEQILGEPVSVATDIYALGIILYELLSGTHPFGSVKKRSQDLTGMVSDSPAALASSALTGPSAGTIAEARSSRPTALRRLLRGDLDRIVRMAMAREPAKRYVSADALAEDVRRHLVGLPVKARRETLFYRSGRFIKRHRAGMSAVTAVILALSMGLIAATWQADRARNQAEIALKSKAFVASLLRQSNPGVAEQGAELRAVDLLRQSAQRVEDELASTPDLQAELRIVIAEGLLSLGDFDRAVELADAGVAQLRDMASAEPWLLAEGLYLIAKISNRQGQVQRAEQVAREGLDLASGSTGSAPPLLRPRLLDALASALQGQGKVEEARHNYLASLQLRIGILGSDDPGLASTYNNLGSNATYLQDFRQAERDYLRAAELLTSGAGREHPRMASVQLGLGAAQMLQGRLDQAEQSLMLALDLANRKLGPESALSAIVVGSLGRLRREQGDLAEARDLLDRSVTIARQRGHVRTEITYGIWLGQVLLETGLDEEARQVYQRIRVLSDRDSKFRVPHYELLEIGDGVLMVRAGLTQAGREQSERAIRQLDSQIRDDSLLYAEAALLHSHLLVAAGDLDAAQLWRGRSEELFLARLGPNHPRTSGRIDHWGDPDADR